MIRMKTDVMLLILVTLCILLVLNDIIVAVKNGISKIRILIEMLLSFITIGCYRPFFYDERKTIFGLIIKIAIGIIAILIVISLLRKNPT